MPDPVRLPERVVFANAPQVLEDLALEVGLRPVHIDLSACTEFDSSLIAVLLDMMRRAGAAGCVVSGASSNMVKLARLYGADRILFGSRDDA